MIRKLDLDKKIPTLTYLTERESDILNVPNISTTIKLCQDKSCDCKYILSSPFKATISKYPNFPNDIHSEPGGSKSELESRISVYFSTILNYSSFFGFVPFQIELEANDLYTIVHLSIFRKIFCIFVQLAAIACYIFHYLEVLFFSKSQRNAFTNITEAFDFVADSGTFILILLFMNTFWRRQNEVLEIVELTRTKCSKTCTRIHKTIAIAIVLIGYLGCGYITLTHMAHAIEWESIESSNNIVIKIMFSSAGYYITVCVLMHAMTVSIFAQIFLVMIALAMRSSLGQFCLKMDATLISGDIIQGLDIYKSLRKLSTSIIRTFGDHVLVYYVISVAFYAKIPEATIWKMNFEVTTIIINFGFSCLTWLVAAEFHAIIRDKVQLWTSQVQDLDGLKTDTRIKLLNLGNDNLLDPVGISCKFFTVTYGFLGSMLGLIVTYAIIVFQVQAKPMSPDIQGMSMSTNDLQE